MADDIFSEESIQDEEDNDVETWDNFEGYEYVDPQMASTYSDDLYDEECDEAW